MARPLDWESCRNYTLTVNVTDGVHFVSTTVRIQVSDVNEHRPKFHKRSFIASVAENSAAGTEVIRVAASDVDEDNTLLFSIFSAVSPDSQSKFAINENTGVITTTESLDRETTAEHTLVVLVKDRGIHSRFDLARVSINVIDMNDGYPVFRNLVSTVNIPAGSPAGTIIASVEASDSDTGLCFLLPIASVSLLSFTAFNFRRSQCGNYLPFGGFTVAVCYRPGNRCN